MRDHWKQLLKEIDYQPGESIIDIGGAMDPVPIADMVVDIQNYGRGGMNYHLCDITWETLPFKDNEFDICICSHTLEDLTSPALVLREMSRVAKRGIIDTPHRGRESVKWFHPKEGHTGPPDPNVWSFGASHHKWLVEEIGDYITFVVKSYHLLMRYPITEWKGPEGVHYVWKDNINFDILYDVNERDIENDYKFFHTKWLETNHGESW